MKKQIYIFMCITALASGLQASLPVQYWNDNVKKPKSSITHPLSMQQKCSQTVAMIKERKTVNLEKSVPLLMEVLTKEIHTMQEVVPTQEYIEFERRVDNIYKPMMTPITTGPSYELCNTIINKNELLKKRNLSLQYALPKLNNHCINNNEYAFVLQSYVVLTSLYDKKQDATKLFGMHHELQHQLNGDQSIRMRSYFKKNKSVLADLTQTPYVRSILKPHIKNAQGQNLQDILQQNGPSLQQEVSRYEEYRADTGALHSIDCPCCIKEASQGRFNNPGYYPGGYLYSWQLQPRIKELQKKGTICQHHHENGEKIDTSITDGSTLMKRLHIIQK